MIRLSCVEHPFRWRSFENVPSVNGRAHTNTQKYCQSSKCRHSFRMKLLKSHQLSLISLPFARISFTEIDNESLTQTCLPAHYIITSERGFVFFFIFLFRCFCWWAVAFFFPFHSTFLRFQWWALYLDCILMNFWPVYAPAGCVSSEFCEWIVANGQCGMLLMIIFSH